jgi:hypothetical protein
MATNSGKYHRGPLVSKLDFFLYIMGLGNGWIRRGVGVIARSCAGTPPMKEPGLIPAASQVHASFAARQVAVSCAAMGFELDSWGCCGIRCRPWGNRMKPATSWGRWAGLLRGGDFFHKWVGRLRDATSDENRCYLLCSKPSALDAGGRAYPSPN